MAIPFRASRPDPMFLYGTLMDPDVLGLVLARPVVRAELTTGWLAGYRRVYLKGRSYPTLVRSSGLEPVRGLLFTAPGQCDIRRCNKFEGEEYEAVRRPVSTATVTMVMAWTYVAAPGSAESNRAWDLDEWRAQEKASFMSRCHDWLER